MSAPSTTWRGFRLIPDDVLFFRDGRPATRGDDHYLASVFPPHPSTLYGALRTRRLLDEGVDVSRLGPDREGLWSELSAELREEVGEWGGFGSLALRGPWLVRDENEVLLPAPADLGVSLAPPAKPSRSGEPQPPTVQRVARFLPEPEGSESPGSHSHPLAPLLPFVEADGEWTPWPAATPPRAVRGWYLTPGGFSRWAQGGCPAPSDFVHQSDLWADEPRVGVAIDEDERTALAGHLFTFGFVRVRKWITLGFEVCNTALRPERRVRLGGEGRTCWLTGGPPLPDPVEGSFRELRLAFATPCLADRGAWPPGFSPTALEAKLGTGRLRLRGASVPGHVEVGGWDLARGRPKPLRRAIPAGAVYLAEVPPDAQSVDASTLHGTTHASYPSEHLARQGFGTVLVGAEPRPTS